MSTIDLGVPSDVAAVGMATGAIVIGFVLMVRRFIPRCLAKAIIALALAAEVFFAFSFGLF